MNTRKPAACVALIVGLLSMNGCQAARPSSTARQPGKPEVVTAGSSTNGTDSSTNDTANNPQANPTSQNDPAQSNQSTPTVQPKVELAGDPNQAMTQFMDLLKKGDASAVAALVSEDGLSVFNYRITDGLAANVPNAQLGAVMQRMLEGASPKLLAHQVDEHRITLAVYGLKPPGISAYDSIQSGKPDLEYIRLDKAGEGWQLRAVGFDKYGHFSKTLHSRDSGFTKLEQLPEHVAWLEGDVSAVVTSQGTPVGLRLKIDGQEVPFEFLGVPIVWFAGAYVNVHAIKPGVRVNLRLVSGLISVVADSSYPTSP